MHPLQQVSRPASLPAIKLTVTKLQRQTIPKPKPLVHLAGRTKDKDKLPSLDPHNPEASPASKAAMTTGETDRTGSESTPQTLQSNSSEQVPTGNLVDLEDEAKQTSVPSFFMLIRPTILPRVSPYRHPIWLVHSTKREIQTLRLLFHLRDRCSHMYRRTELSPHLKVRKCLNARVGRRSMVSLRGTLGAGEEVPAFFTDSYKLCAEIVDTLAICYNSHFDITNGSKHLCASCPMNLRGFTCHPTSRQDAKKRDHRNASTQPNKFVSSRFELAKLLIPNHHHESNGEALARSCYVALGHRHGPANN
jgi:hypothetical protein